MPRALKILLYAGVFLFSFVLFVYWMFPMDTLKNRLILAMEKGLGPDFQVTIEEMKTYRITGAALKEVTIQKSVEGKTQPWLKVEKARARVGLFSLIFGNPKVRVGLWLAGGRLQVSAQKSEDLYRLEGTFDSLDVGKMPYFQKVLGLKAVSDIDGEFKLRLNPQQPLRTEGELKMAVNKVSLQKSTVPLGEMGTFPLPDLILAKSPSRIAAEIAKGSIRVEGLALKGDDFQFDVQGRIFMASEAARYRINLQGQFQFSEKLWKVFDPLLPEPFASELQKQKGPGGLFPISLSGQLASPQIYSGALRIYPFKPF